MSDPKKAPERAMVRLGSTEPEAGEDREERPAREHVLLRIGPAAIEALLRAAFDEAPRPEVVLPMVYEIVIVPGPDMQQ